MKTKSSWLKILKWGDIVLLSILAGLALIANLTEIVPGIDPAKLAYMTIGIIAGYLAFERWSSNRDWEHLDVDLARMKNEILAESQKGPIRLLDTRQYLDSYYKEHFIQAGYCADVIALTAENFVRVSGGDLVNKLFTSSCTIRILILDPAKKDGIWQLRLKDEPRTSLEWVNKQLEASKEFFKSCEVEIKQRINRGERILGSYEVRLYQSIPYFGYFQADDLVTLGLYYSEKVGFHSYAVEFTNCPAGLKDDLKHHFDHLWLRSAGRIISSAGFSAGTYIDAPAKNK